MQSPMDALNIPHSLAIKQPDLRDSQPAKQSMQYTSQTWRGSAKLGSLRGTLMFRSHECPRAAIPSTSARDQHRHRYHTSDLQGTYEASDRRCCRRRTYPGHCRGATCCLTLALVRSLLKLQTTSDNLELCVRKRVSALCIAFLSRHCLR